MEGRGVRCRQNQASIPVRCNIRLTDRQHTPSAQMLIRAHCSCRSMVHRGAAYQLKTRSIATRSIIRKKAVRGGRKASVVVVIPNLQHPQHIESSWAQSQSLGCFLEVLSAQRSFWGVLKFREGIVNNLSFRSGSSGAMFVIKTT